MGFDGQVSAVRAWLGQHFGSLKNRAVPPLKDRCQHLRSASLGYRGALACPHCRDYLAAIGARRQDHMSNEAAVRSIAGSVVE